MSHQSPVTSHQPTVSSKDAARAYRQLKVWERATELAITTYEATKSFPKDELYGLTSQLRRAVVSIPSNIAEGSERRSDKDFLRFLRMAGGSLAEAETQLYIAMKLHYLEDSDYFHLQKLGGEVGKMINGLSSSLEGKLRPTGDWRLETGD